MLRVISCPLGCFAQLPQGSVTTKEISNQKHWGKNGAVLSAYDGFITKQIGTINIPCKYKERKINCNFYVTDTSGPAILGTKACIALKVVSLQCTINGFNAPALIEKVRITLKVMYHRKSSHQSEVNKTWWRCTLSVSIATLDVSRITIITSPWTPKCLQWSMPPVKFLYS